ncbi:MAG: MBL fold metallo-hydrolase [Acidobacteriota bacterium]
MQLHFWGVRGSSPTPGASTHQFGGNTSCIEVRSSSDDVILLDGGTGIREAGADIARRTVGAPRSIHLFLTHFHWDHIQGIPFFAPLFVAENHVTIYSSRFSAPLDAALHGLMTSPYFSIGVADFKARVSLVTIDQQPVRLGDISIEPIEVNHPQGACAYRVKSSTAAAIYAPDREHGDERLDRLFADQVRGVNALITDSQYTPDEYPAHQGWGHSTWLESVKLAREAGAKKLVLFHHDPARSDGALAEIQTAARREFAETFVAKEGWTLEV